MGALTPCDLPRSWVHRNLTTGLNQVRPPAARGAGRRTIAVSAQVVSMRDVEPHVSEKVRVWCVARGERNVHATLRGTVDGYGDRVPADVDLSTWRKVTYNPFRRPDFHYADTGETFTGAARALVVGGYAYVPDTRGA